ncbi:MAG TPA: DUF1592 domain-containing protein [Planctomycetota bacterium]|nr:DUF1592 domain-containing protein [Planctomycetota bacterium]
MFKLVHFPILVLLAAKLPAAESARADFDKDIRPLLEAHCIKCHGPQKKKGGADFSTFTDQKSLLKHRKLWRTAAIQVETLEMPPAEERQLLPPEREKLAAWMKQIANTIDCSNPADRHPGPSLIHRLNRSEYNLTIRDLIGIDFDAGAAVGMPDDSSGHGYANLVNTLILPPVLMEKYFAAADRILDLVIGPMDLATEKKEDADKRKKNKAAFERLFFAKPDAGVSKRDAAQKIIERFAARAFRRPVQPDEISRLMRLYDIAEKKNDRFENGVRLMLKAVLVSPHFLFRIEQDRAPQGSQEAYRVSDYELATRLSYFLWSSMPDEVLLELAAQKKLSEPAVLEAQVRRMLLDPKAKALTTHFAARWLQIHKLAEARPSTEFFPTFTTKLRQAMYDETSLFFDKLREENRSVLELLNADYTYVNQDLAKHYGLPEVKGPEMRRVALKPESNRGGLLGMGSILALTSHTSRTSPTLRGKWILEVIFGTPPPPPPPDAGTLKEEKQKGKEPKTFREQMAMHASQSACAACHKKIDPLGFGLENFDAVGSWRDSVGGKPIENSGQLPTGEKFAGAGELKKIILKNQDAFVRNLIEQMLTYALGRELQYFDDCPVKEAKTALEKNGYTFSSLVLGIVNSYPFQHRRNIDAAVESHD